MSRRLAGSVAAWADGAGVTFSEALRELTSRGLASSAGQAFSQPGADSQALAREVRRAKKEAVDEIVAALDEAVNDITYSLGARR